MIDFIYVNGANKNIQTSMGKLVHDFKCQNPDEFYYKDLRDSVPHFKTTPKGVSNMGQIFTEYAEEIAKEYDRECRAAGKAEGQAIGRV